MKNFSEQNGDDFKEIAQEKTIGIPKEMEVKPWTFYLPKYDSKYHTLIRETENLPEPNRTISREVGIKEIEDQFTTERRTEFESKNIEKPVSHSCTKKYRGGTKDCGWKYVRSPHPEIYTRNDLLKLAGQAKRITTMHNGTVAGIYQTKSGRGRIFGTLTAKFIYRPDYIDQQIRENIGDLFKAIVLSPSGFDINKIDLSEIDAEILRNNSVSNFFSDKE